MTCNSKGNKIILAFRWPFYNTGTARWQPKLFHYGFSLVCHRQHFSEHILLLAHCSITSRERIAQRAFIEVPVNKWWKLNMYKLGKLVASQLTETEKAPLYDVSHFYITSDA
jgi:hypothetical protein